MTKTVPTRQMKECLGHFCFLQVSAEEKEPAPGNTDCGVDKAITCFFLWIGSKWVQNPKLDEVLVGANDNKNTGENIFYWHPEPWGRFPC